MSLDAGRAKLSPYNENNLISVYIHDQRLHLRFVKSNQWNKWPCSWMLASQSGSWWEIKLQIPLSFDEHINRYMTHQRLLRSTWTDAVYLSLDCVSIPNINSRFYPNSCSTAFFYFIWQSVSIMFQYYFYLFMEAVISVCLTSCVQWVPLTVNLDELDCECEYALNCIGMTMTIPS